MHGLTAIENIQSVFSAFGEVKEAIIYESRVKGSCKNSSHFLLKNDTEVPISRRKKSAAKSWLNV